ncbi:hypothetical protein TNCV_2153771 [Trichonephila clavipes]|nr:hypothetical protein TNCV_2153771 [Trichonephila clavipes]
MSSSSSFIPVPLAHADNQGEGHQRGAVTNFQPIAIALRIPVMLFVFSSIATTAATGFRPLPGFTTN